MACAPAGAAETAAADDEKDELDCMGRRKEDPPPPPPSRLPPPPPPPPTTVLVVALELRPKCLKDTEKEDAIKLAKVVIVDTVQTIAILDYLPLVELGRFPNEENKKKSIILQSQL